jgi:hypothetical protein
VTGRNNTIEIISGCICSNALLIALFIDTPWSKGFSFPDHVLASNFAGCAPEVRTLLFYRKLPLFAALAAADFSPALQGWVSKQVDLRRVATLETPLTMVPISTVATRRGRFPRCYPALMVFEN